jgi:hypothetical protein
LQFAFRHAADGVISKDRPYRNPEDFLAALTSAAPVDLDCQHPAS